MADMQNQSPANPPAPLNRPPRHKKKAKSPLKCTPIPHTTRGSQTHHCTVSRVVQEHSTSDFQIFLFFTKGNSVQTVPSLSKLLTGITVSVIGLQYVWEYRSPSKSVPPHYQCKLCSLSCLQPAIIDHVKGWKHGFRYLKKAHPDKVSGEEEDAVKHASARWTFKTIIAEVEKTEGRGQIKVILKEPCDVMAFKGLRSAVPSYRPLQGSGMGSMSPPFSSRFQSRLSGECSSYGGPGNGYLDAGCGETSYGGYMSGQDYSNPGMNQGFFSDMNYHQPGRGNGFGPSGGGEEYKGNGPGLSNQSDAYSGNYQHNQSFANLPSNRQGLLGAAPDTSGSSSSNNLRNTLLTHLDNFKIENEADAQLVLQVTQKLTDVLMEYRLGSVAAVSSLTSLPNSSTSFSSSISKFSSSGDQYSNNFSGPPTFSDSPANYYQ